MSLKSIYAYLSTLQAIKDSNLKSEIYRKNSRIGVIAGSGTNTRSSGNLFKCNRLHNIFNELSTPYSVIKYMPSGISACLSTLLELYGVSYSISSACATSAHCIGHAYELIKYGKQDIIFAGGSEELTKELVTEFDAMRVLSKNYNLTPKIASRAYDKHRDGFVLSEGSGILVLEELNHAILRKARIYAEIVGYGCSSDGYGMFIPSENGITRCMKMALKQCYDPIDYLNTHGTSTIKGDLIELNAIKNVFVNQKSPIISATKSITGHSLGTSGVHEVIYTLIMMNNNFIAPSINIDNIDDCAKNMNIAIQMKEKKVNLAMSNSFGFGGTNVSLVFKK